MQKKFHGKTHYSLEKESRPTDFFPFDKDSTKYILFTPFNTKSYNMELETANVFTCGILIILVTLPEKGTMHLNGEP